MAFSAYVAITTKIKELAKRFLDELETWVEENHPGSSVTLRKFLVRVVVPQAFGVQVAPDTEGKLSLTSSAEGGISTLEEQRLFKVLEEDEGPISCEDCGEESCECLACPETRPEGVDCGSCEDCGEAEDSERCACTPTSHPLRPSQEWKPGDPFKKTPGQLPPLPENREDFKDFVVAMLNLICGPGSDSFFEETGLQLLLELMRDLGLISSLCPTKSNGYGGRWTLTDRGGRTNVFESLTPSLFVPLLANTMKEDYSRIQQVRQGKRQCRDCWEFHPVLDAPSGLTIQGHRHPDGRMCSGAANTPKELSPLLRAFAFDKVESSSFVFTPHKPPKETPSDIVREPPKEPIKIVQGDDPRLGGATPLLRTPPLPGDERSLIANTPTGRKVASIINILQHFYIKPLRDIPPLDVLLALCQQLQIGIDLRLVQKMDKSLVWNLRVGSCPTISVPALYASVFIDPLYAYFRTREEDIYCLLQGMRRCAVCREYVGLYGTLTDRVGKHTSKDPRRNCPGSVEPPMSITSDLEAFWRLGQKYLNQKGKDI